MDYYLGEIRLFAGSFAPAGWHLCDGTTLNISAYDALYSLLGTIYGGDGQTTFKLPDLRSRVPVGQGTGLGLTSRSLGQQFGVAQVSLTTNQMPIHSHGLVASTSLATAAQATGLVPAQNGSDLFYAPQPVAGANPQTMAPASVTVAGNNLPHDNIMPSMAMNYIIALQGIYPSRN
ncbi:MAG: phage tail protein [Delftia acidovorans]|uniref:Phage tail protein n=1 Tax=Delftia acidovorans TaxID=80866 RepID=A0A7T2S6G9_DELAC|nr:MULTISPECIES: tail fiber protein [Delftia]MBB1650115.1 phage tail protein [Delftia sp. UME58]MBL8357214.1 phage tail protein [Delftia acidovorans]QPS09801.1 phage tail protein [Delftia acidovorans]